MESNIKTKAAAALFPLLSLFHEVDGVCLDAVRLGGTDGVITQIALRLGPKSFVIQTESEDDSIEISITSVPPEGQVVSDMSPWSEFIHKQMGWGWVLVNQQGYLDGVLLSFGGVIPQILIVVVASSLQVKRIV